MSDLPISSVTRRIAIVYGGERFYVDDEDRVKLYAARAILSGLMFYCPRIHSEIVPDHHSWFLANGVDGINEFYPELIPHIDSLLATPEFEHLAPSDKRSHE